MRANEACLSCRLVGESDEGERSRDLSANCLLRHHHRRRRDVRQLQLQPYAGSTWDSCVRATCVTSILL